MKNFTWSDMINASVAAHAYLESTSTFLLEEAAAIEGDVMIAQLWSTAGSAIQSVLQVRADALPGSVKLILRCSPRPCNYSKRLAQQF